MIKNEKEFEQLVQKFEELDTPLFLAVARQQIDRPNSGFARFAAEVRRWINERLDRGEDLSEMWVPVDDDNEISVEGAFHRMTELVLEVKQKHLITIMDNPSRTELENNLLVAYRKALLTLKTYAERFNVNVKNELLTEMENDNLNKLFREVEKRKYELWFEDYWAKFGNMLNPTEIQLSDFVSRLERTVKIIREDKVLTTSNILLYLEASEIILDPEKYNITTESVVAIRKAVIEIANWVKARDEVMRGHLEGEMTKFEKAKDRVVTRQASQENAAETRLGLESFAAGDVSQPEENEQGFGKLR